MSHQGNHYLMWFQTEMPLERFAHILAVLEYRDGSLSNNWKADFCVMKTSIRGLHSNNIFRLLTWISVWGTGWLQIHFIMLPTRLFLETGAYDEGTKIWIIPRRHLQKKLLKGLVGGIRPCDRQKVKSHQMSAAPVQESKKLIFLKRIFVIAL